ncbi:MAG: type II toxin-antitoxin system PemK/MazF family toxin [Pirellulaceae bacterium]
MSSARLRRGDVVLVDIPYLSGAQFVKRPALVVCDPGRMLDVIIAGITSRVRSPLPATHYVISAGHPDWPDSGLRMESAVRCDRLFTIDHADVHRIVGRLSSATLLEVDSRLKIALAIA